jgi:hypothetical protein
MTAISTTIEFKGCCVFKGVRRHKFGHQSPAVVRDDHPVADRPSLNNCADKLVSK